MELRIGVIGTGAIGEDHTKRINQKISGSRVVAVSDINVENSKRVADTYGARFIEKGEDLINSPDVDAIIIASWDPTHEGYILEAIKAGKFVFVKSRWLHQQRAVNEL